MDQITDPSRKMLDHTIPAWAESEATYFITICCRERGKNRLAFPDIAKIIFDAAQAYEQRKIWFVRFMLLMPDHLHGIFDFPSEASMQASFANWKRFLSRMHGIRFQRDFFDHRLRSDESFCQKVEYIRHNPVRAGIVSEPEDWPYVYLHDDQLFADQAGERGRAVRPGPPVVPFAGRAVPPEPPRQNSPPRPVNIRDR